MPKKKQQEWLLSIGFLNKGIEEKDGAEFTILAEDGAMAVQKGLKKLKAFLRRSKRYSIVFASIGRYDDISLDDITKPMAPEYQLRARFLGRHALSAKRPLTAFELTTEGEARSAYREAERE